MKQVYRMYKDTVLLTSTALLGIYGEKVTPNKGHSRRWAIKWLCVNTKVESEKERSLMSEVEIITGMPMIARAVKYSAEQLKSDYGINGYNEENEERNVQQWNHRFDDGIQHNLKTC